MQAYATGDVAPAPVPGLGACAPGALLAVRLATDVGKQVPDQPPTPKAKPNTLSPDQFLCSMGVTIEQPEPAQTVASPEFVRRALGRPRFDNESDWTAKENNN